MKRKEIHFAIYIVVFIVFAIISFHSKFIHNTTRDTLSYYYIAYKYTHGSFLSAINGCWSPLISILLIPFLRLQLSPWYAFNILSILLAVVLVIEIKTIIKRLKINNRIVFIASLCSIPIIFNFVFYPFGADILLTCILFALLIQVFKKDFFKYKKNALICGLIGGVMYLAKGYAFPFFIAFMSAIYLFHFISKKRQESSFKILKHYAITLMTFLLIFGMWVSALSYKYERFTYSTTSKYTYSVVGPSSKGFYEGMLNYPSDFYSPFEEPSYTMRMGKISEYSPTKNIDSLKYLFSNIIKGNLETILKDFCHFSFLYPIILIMIIIFIVHRRNKFNHATYKLLTILLCGGIYLLGYTLISVEERYIWPIWLLLLAVGAKCLQLFTLNKSFRYKILLYVIFTLSFILYPIYNTFNYNRDDSVYYEISQKLKGLMIKGNIASNVNFGDTMNILFYLNYKNPDQDIIHYKGCTVEQNEYTNYFIPWKEINIAQPKDDKTLPDNLLKILNKYKIDYYFVYGRPSNIKTLVNSGKLQEIKTIQIPHNIYNLSPNLYIYKMH